MNEDPIGSIVMIVGVVLAIFVMIAIARAVRIVPQSEAYVVERLGRFRSVLHGGIHLLVPFVDRVAARIDLREQVVNFPSQSVITADQAMVEIDSVIYFQITDPRSATYEVANFLQAIEQLTATTLRNLIGSLDLEETQTSRESINKQLRGVLDEATGPWGIRVTRVELKSIEPPPNVLSAMVQQITAERTKRATILTAEAEREAQIKKAEGAKQAAVLAASEYIPENKLGFYSLFSMDYNKAVYIELLFMTLLVGISISGILYGAGILYAKRKEFINDESCH